MCCACDGSEEFEETDWSASEEFLLGLGVVLDLWVQENAGISKSQEPGRFHSSQPPSISIQNYIKRLRKYFLCSDECFVFALVYMDRIGKKNLSMSVCDFTVHRLLVIALMLAAKFHEDKIYVNTYYAKAGGLSLKEVNLLERVMLQELGWKMFVTTHEYKLYHRLVC